MAAAVTAKMPPFRRRQEGLGPAALGRAQPGGGQAQGHLVAEHIVDGLSVRGIGRHEEASARAVVDRPPGGLFERTLQARFREDRLGLTASSLTFTSIISLVPLLTVMLAVFSAFPMFASFQVALQKYFRVLLSPLQLV